MTPLFSVYRAWEQRTREAHALKAQSAAAAAAGGGGGGGGGAARASPPPVADAPSRPADRFFSKLGPALQAHGISTEAPRREWPAEVLRRTLLELVAETPRDLISQVRAALVSRAR